MEFLPVVFVIFSYSSSFAWAPVVVSAKGKILDQLEVIVARHGVFIVILICVCLSLQGLHRSTQERCPNTEGFYSAVSRATGAQDQEDGLPRTSRLQEEQGGHRARMRADCCSLAATTKAQVTGTVFCRPEKQGD